MWLTLPTLRYETELSSQTILTPSRHKPKQVKRWEDFAPGTERFVADLPDTSPVLTPPRAVDPADHSLGEETTIFLMEKYHFTYLKQLGGGSSGLPEVDYAWHKNHKDLAGSDGQKLSHKCEWYVLRLCQADAVDGLWMGCGRAAVWQVEGSARTVCGTGLQEEVSDVHR